MGNTKKKVRVIYMKRLIIIAVVLSLISIPFLTYECEFKDNLTLFLNDALKTPKESKEELYKDIFITLLDPYIQKAIEDYYEKPLFHDPWSVEVLDIERPNGDGTFWFRIKLKVMPYVMAHNVVGTDHITFNVSGDGEVKIEKFQHIKDHPIPPHLKN